MHVEFGWAVLVALFFGGPWILAGVAWARARSAAARLDRLELQLSALAKRLAGRPATGLDAEPLATSPAPEPGPVPAAGRLVSPPDAAPPNAPPEATPPAQVPRPVASAAPPAPGPAQSLEERVALVWFARIGAAVFLLGALYFFKYAIDSAWIGPAGRVGLGAVVGVAMLSAGEGLGRTARPAYVQALLGTGLAVLFVVAYAGSAFYHLVSPAAAFAAVGVCALLGGALAVRHRGELVLVIALVGGLVAPVLLSTGEDRPAALFGYLLVFTLLALAASARAGFRVAPCVAMAGTALLFAGWYGRFFDVHAASQGWDGDASAAAGAYRPLMRRLLPVAAVAAFLGSWVLQARSARRRDPAGPFPLWFLVTALLLAHAAATALLVDAPLALGAALLALGAASAHLLGREGRSELLGVPLGASFLALLGAASRDQVAPLPTLAVLGVWCGLYAWSFLRTPPRAAAGGRALGLGLAGAAGAAVLVVAAVLLRHEPRALGAVALLVGAAYGAVALVAGAGAGAGAAGLLFAAGAASWAGLGLAVAAMEGEPAADHVLLAIAAVWAALVLAASALALVRRREPPTPLRLATASLGGAGLMAIALLVTRSEEHLLRAAVAAAAGAADLALGAALLRAARRPASILLGQALALLALSAALLLSGASVTLIWLALAAVAAHLAAGARDRDWLWGALALFAAAALRLACVDLGAPERALLEFVGSLGAAGAPWPRFLFNARAYALLGGGAAMLLSARALARVPERAFGRSAAALAAAAHAALLLLAVGELRGLLVTLPSPPHSGDLQAFTVWSEARSAALTAQAGPLSMFTTLVLGAYAAMLVAAGFAGRERVHRWLGLGLFAATLAKLALYDIWNLARVYQIAVFLGVGALLLAASFLYARYGARLLDLLRGSGGPGLALALAVSGLAGAHAQALEPRSFGWAAPVSGVASPGLWRFEIPPELYLASGAPALPDLRLRGPGGEVPYAVRRVGGRPPQRALEPRLLNPTVAPDGATQAVFDLGPAPGRHSAVDLTLDGEEFLRRARIETSSDGHGWGLTAEGRVFAVAGDPEARGSRVRYPWSDARFLRVTLPPGEGGPVRITGGRVLLGEVAEPAPPRERAAAVARQGRDATGRRTLVDLDLGGAGLPVNAVRIVTAARSFERRVRVRSSADRSVWIPSGQGVVWRAEGGPGGGPREDLEIPASPGGRRWLRLEIEDGDAAPLPIAAASVRWPAEEVVFAASAGGAHTALVGAPGAAAPAYDVAAVLARSPGVVPGAAVLGAVAPNPAWAPPAPAALPFTERHRTAIAGALALVVAALAAWTVRLLRRAGGEPAGS
jgi:hypothetical protein